MLQRSKAFSCCSFLGCSLKQYVYRPGIFVHPDTQVTFWSGLHFERSAHHVCCGNKVLALALQRFVSLRDIGPSNIELVLRSAKAHGMDALKRLLNHSGELAISFR